MSIKPTIAANWKMNKTPNEGIEFFDEIKSNFQETGHHHNNWNCIYRPKSSTVPSSRLHKIVIGSRVDYNGEISVDMIKNCGADYVILGHREKNILTKLINKSI